MELLKSYLTFNIGKEQFATNAAFVNIIIEVPEVTKVPEMPVYMLGVINLRGRVIPVIDSRIKFGVQETEINTNTCIVVMELEMDGKEVVTGFLVDSVCEVVDLEPEQIKEPPTIGVKYSKFITGVFDVDDKFCMILNMNQVLSSDELVKAINGELVEG